MIDRGIIKWQPFNSCMEPNKIIKEIEREKNKEILPILSEEQLQIIGEKIIDAYNLKLVITIKYYFDGKVYKTKGTIKHVNIQNKKIYINTLNIYFKQILDVEY